MKQFSGKILLGLGMLSSVFLSAYAAQNKPKLTVIIVVDQFAHHYINKLRPYFRYGLKKLLNSGIVYQNAYMPHGMPATATGHTALNTGTYANYHGIIGNKWFNKEGKSINCDDDSAQTSTVFSPDGLYDYGKSPRNIMVSGISDQFKLAERPGKPHHVYALSIKSRAAIATASKLGKAVWFDDATGLFTSSKAYFESLPQWLKDFNAKSQISNLKQITWELMYKKDSKAYNFNNINNYTSVSYPKSLINGPIPIGLHVNKEEPFELYLKTPQSNQLVFNLAKECIAQHMSKKNDRMLLWINISGLDKLGHTFGPESLESIDMIYHLDKQIEDFMEYAYDKVKKEKVLFGLTADHGVGKIPEHLKEEGLYHPKRIAISKLKKELNDTITKKYGVTNIVQKIKQPYLYLNQQQLKTINSELQKIIFLELKNNLESQPGIKTVWTYDELTQSTFINNIYAHYFKQQLFPSRSGQLIIQTFPHVIITDHTTGASHKTPYEYDTHIPLILYQANNQEKQSISQKVLALQLPNTLSAILNVPHAPASNCSVLPGINADK